MEQKQKFTIETATTWALIIAAAALPVFFIPLGSFPFVFTKSMFFVVFGVGALMLYILTRLRRGSIIIPPLTIIGALWLVPISLLISSAFSSSSFTDNFFGSQLDSTTTGFVLIGVLVATVFALAFRKKEQFVTLAKALFFGYGAVLLLQLILLILSFGLLSSFGVSVPGTASVLGSMSDLAVFFGGGVIALLVTLQTIALSKKWRLSVYGALILSLFFLVLANFTLVWIALGIFALALFIQGMLKQGTDTSENLEGVKALYSTQEAPLGGEHNAKRMSTQSLILSLSVLALSLIFVIGGNTLGNVIAQSAGTDQALVRPSWKATLSIAQNVYKENPLVGTGPHTFAQEWLQFKPQKINTSPFWNIDFITGVGYLPTIVAVTGFVGALAWVLFFLAYLVFGFRALVLSRAKGTLFSLSITSFLIGIYLWGITIVYVPSVTLLALAFMAVGVFVATLRFGSNETKEWGIFFARSPRIGFAIVFFLTLVLLASIVALFFVGERYIGAVYLGRATQEAQQGNFDSARRHLARAVQLVPRDSEYRLSVALDQNDLTKVLNDTSLSKEEAQNSFQKLLATSVQNAILATQLDPNNYQNWMTLGNVYQSVVPLGIDGSYKNAKTAYERAQKLNPNNPQILLVQAQLEIAQKNNDAARELLNKAIAMKRDYVPAIFLLSQLEVQEGNTKEALASAEAAAFFQPNDQNVLLQVALLRQATGDIQGAIAVLERIVRINPSFANARYLLASLYANTGNLDAAREQLQAIADLSEENAKAVASQLQDLRDGKNPFPKPSEFNGSTPVAN